MIKLSKTKTSLIVTLVCILCIATLLAAFLFTPHTPVNAFNGTSSVNSNAVVVPQLWGESSQSFSYDAMSTLLSYISSDGTINGVNTTQQTAADIRGYTYGGKESGKSVVVTIGDYQWQVVYLTRTNNTSGDRIATLLMVNNDGTARITPGGYGTGSNWTGAYPSNMYGTSHIRAVTLNNGGQYINITSNGSNPTTTVSAGSPSTTHKYALYTAPSLGLTQYLVQPNNVWYQTQAQLTGSANPTGYTLNNESLSTTISTGWYNNYASTYSYQTKTYYTQWGSDYLWLPSLSESGTAEDAGIWELSTIERSASNEWWSRSGCYNDSYSAYFLYPSGSISRIGMVHTSYGVRPSLHLNLDSALNNLTNDIIVESNDSTQGTVSGGGVYDFEYTGSSTITALANYGYVFDYWQDSSGNKIYENPYTFPVTKSETYTAYFRLPQITITSSTSGSEIANTNTEKLNLSTRYTLTFNANRYISAIQVNSGATQTISTLNGALITDNSCTAINFNTNTTGSELFLEIINIKADVTINLIFVDIAQSYTPASGGVSLEGVALQVSGGSGATFEAVGEARITGYSQAENITYVHVSAVPSSGYYFVGWQTNDDTDLTDYGSSADIPYNLIEGKILTAVFAPTPSNSQTNSTTDNTGTEIG